MHINIELIDAVFLTSSMLLEIPQAAAAARRFFRGDRKLFQSRHLRRLIDQYDRNLFNGPPDNTRDHIIAATKALALGDWQKCLEFTSTSRLWNLFSAPEAIRTMLEEKVKEAGFCTFVLAFGPTYSTLSLEHLSATFKVTSAKLTKIVDCLVQDHGVPVKIEEGHLSWAAVVELSPLQELVLQIRDKTQVLAERNEDSLEFIRKQKQDAIAA